jgi:hypothetical protein
MRSKSKVTIISFDRLPSSFIDDIYVPFEENDMIFELSKEVDKDLMEAVDGPDAADSCACCNKAATNKKDKLKNW